MKKTIGILVSCAWLFLFWDCRAPQHDLTYYASYPVKFAKTKVTVEQGGFEFYLPQHFTYTTEEVDLGIDTVIALHAASNKESVPLDILTIEKGKGFHLTGTPEDEIALILERYDETPFILSTGSIDWFPGAHYVHYRPAKKSKQKNEILILVFKDTSNFFYFVTAYLAPGSKPEQRMAVMVQSIKTLTLM
jgi:hypothetical protein